MWVPHPLNQRSPIYLNTTHHCYLFSSRARHVWPGRRNDGQGIDNEGDGDGYGCGLPDEYSLEHRRFDNAISMLCWVANYKGYY